MYLSVRVGYLSELTSYNRFGRVSGCFYPWMDTPSEPCACYFVLENDDDFVLENEDKLIVLHPVS
jgi:hypothetical protein